MAEEKEDEGQSSPLAQTSLDLNYPRAHEDEALSAFSNAPDSFQYSASLNCIIASVDGSDLEILDVHSGAIVSKASIPKGIFRL